MSSPVEAPAVWMARCAAALARAERPLLVLDYDGTLRDIVESPEKGAPTREILELLESAARRGITVAIVSGRDSDTLASWFGHLPIHLVAEHGGSHRKPTGLFKSRVAAGALRWFATARALLAAATAKADGSMLETKRTSFSWHYRNVETVLGERTAEDLVRRLRDELPAGAEVHRGKMVVEVRPAGVHKGGALRDLAATTRADAVLCAGDDRTDEDMFASSPADAWSIKVGPGETKARYRVGGVAELRRLLIDVVEARRVLHG